MKTQTGPVYSKSLYVSVGRVRSAQGIKGELFIGLFTKETSWEDKWQCLALSSGIENKPGEFLKILEKRPHRKKKQSGFVLKVQSIENRTRAEEFVGRNVFIPRDFLISSDNEVIDPRGVLGFRVLDKTRGNVGCVVDFSGSSMQDTLIVSGCDGEFEVPFVPPIYLSVDKRGETLTMDIPPGLCCGEEL